MSVREIMNICSDTVGQFSGAAGGNGAGLNSSVSQAQREIIRFTNEKTKTDDAMDRLKHLCEEYCD